MENDVILSNICKNKKTLQNPKVNSFHEDLKKIQTTLTKQRKTCQNLVKKITRKIQEAGSPKIQTSFSKIIRTLLILETKLKKEHEFITYRLVEMNHVIRKQTNLIKKLSTSSVCRSCSNELYDNSWKYHDSVSSSRSSCSFEFEETKNDKTSFEKSDTEDEYDGPNKIIRYKKNRKKSYRKSYNSGSYILNENNVNNDSMLRESIINKRNSDDLLKIDNDSVNNASLSESNVTVIQKIISDKEKSIEDKLSTSIQVFEADTNETQENWYASASDQEDEQRTDIYRNNPVLECVNQILLQDINEPPPSPPKTPPKSKLIQETLENIKEESVASSEKDKDSNHNYYETPIKAAPNFYETPQSIYSNDYEQILSKCSSTPSTPQKIVRKNKILRVPPALPPKPAGLMPTYCLQKSIANSETSVSLESEPDYCSISELNLPVKSPSFKKVQVVAEINIPRKEEINVAKNAMVKKTIEKPYIQMAKTAIICDKPEVAKKLTKEKYLTKDEPVIKKESPSKKLNIPKLPQVSEIIIPDEEEHEKEPIKNIENKNVKKNSVKNDKAEKIHVMSPNIDDFDLSQTFEEFKFDDCGLEELNIDNVEYGDKYLDRFTEANKVEYFTSSNPIDSIKKQLELENTPAKVTKNRFAPDFAQTYEYFLECTGLSSKSILTIKK